MALLLCFVGEGGRLQGVILATTCAWMLEPPSSKAHPPLALNSPLHARRMANAMPYPYPTSCDAHLIPYVFPTITTTTTHRRQAVPRMEARATRA